MKAATVLEDYSSKEDMSQALSSLFTGMRDIETSAYGYALSELQEDFDPDTKESLAREAPLNLSGKDRLSWILCETASYLDSISEDLPRDLSEYIEEKIDYNKDRELEQMDASFEIRGKWSKLLDY